MSTPRRLRTLRALEDLGPASIEEIHLFLGWTDRGAVLRHLTHLERQELVAYDVHTNRFALTQKAAMRWKNRHTKNSPVADDNFAVTPGDEGPHSPAPLLGGVGSPGVVTPAHIPQVGVISATAAGASGISAPAAVANINAKVEELVMEMEGNEGLILHILREEHDLWERAAAALADGMAAPDLSNVPNRRRIQTIEDALVAWEKATTGGPCDACGARKPVLAPGQGYMDAEAPGFHTSSGTFARVCSWCYTYFGNGHTADDLRELVGNAVAGVASNPGPGQTYRFATPLLVPFAKEVGTYGTPWSHVTPVQRRAIEMRAAQLIHPKNFVRTQAVADLITVPGIQVPVHGPLERPESAPVTILRPEGMTPREETAAVEAFHTTERDEFLAATPRPWGPDDGSIGDWTALLARQERERKSPALLRERIGGPIPVVATTRPIFEPSTPTITRREPTAEEILSERQTSERAAYLTSHPRPVQSSKKSAAPVPWPGLAGWEALLARHDAERRGHAATISDELRRLEAQQATARDQFLRDNPKPRGREEQEWAGADGWSALMAEQEQTRKRLTGTTTIYKKAN